MTGRVGYHDCVILDFHCHITTPGTQMPDADGQYYRTLGPTTPATQLLGQWAQEAMDTMAERWRTPQALRAYRNAGPLIYTEMARRMTATDEQVLLGEMAENGVNQSVVVAIDPLVPTDEVLKACAHLGGVLIPFGSVDPHAPDYLERFEHLLTRPILGIKFHSDLQNLPLDSERLSALLNHLAASSQAHLPIYLHTGNFPIYRPQDSPWEQTLPRLLREFPTLTFVCGHAGWDSPRAALKAALGAANLFLETSWQPPYLIRRLCDKLGPERLLFGSDFPLFSQRRALRNIRQALNDAEFTMVAGENARRLLRLP
jgi:predicted TIM-barrel fold metal-dependent hydrolase